MSSYGKITFRGNYAYEWKINNFLNRPEANGKEFCSPKFAVTDNNDKHGILYFIIFPKGFVGTSTHVSLGIMLESESREFELFYRWGPYLDDFLMMFWFYRNDKIIYLYLK